MSDARIIRIEDKIDKLNDRLSSIDNTLASQHESLKHHIKRTDLLEKAIEPVKTHVHMVQGGAKILGAIVAFFAVAEGVVAILTHIGK